MKIEAPGVLSGALFLLFWTEEGLCSIASCVFFVAVWPTVDWFVLYHVL